MKKWIWQTVGTGLLSVGMLATAIPASAQVNDVVDEPARPVADADDEFDWGWLGLVGLLGLAGLMRRGREHRGAHYETSTTQRPPVRT